MEEPGVTKGGRTRIKLMIAAIDVLDKMTYQDMRITDICKGAGVSHGLFYHHFQDKQAITEAIMDAFMDLILTRIGETKGLPDPYAKLFVANHHYIEMYRRNTGILRVMLSNTEELPEMKAKLSKISLQWHSKIASSLKDRMGSRKLDSKDQLLIGYSLGGMADELLRQVFILRSPHLKKFRPQKAAADLTELLSILWFRAIFGTDPDQLAMKKAHSLI
jgi:AcrR family transcriptional regulator